VGVEATAQLDGDRARREVDLVVDDEDLGGGEAQLAHELGEGTTARVHVALRLGEHHLAQRPVRSLVAQAAGETAHLAPPVGDALAPGDGIDGEEPGVVPRALVVGPRVAQATDEADVRWCGVRALGHRLLPQCGLLPLGRGPQRPPCDLARHCTKVTGALGHACWALGSSHRRVWASSCERHHVGSVVCGHHRAHVIIRAPLC
jgi:hypothetical protein